MNVAGYEIIDYRDYDYSRLTAGKWIRRSNAGHPQYAYEKIITVDTETYVFDDKDIGYITDWTLTIEEDCCIYGNHVKDLIHTIEQISQTLNGDDTHTIRFYVHNYSYDYTFLRNHMFEAWGEPDRCLAAKSHKYIFMGWSDMGIEFRDSAILTQRSLERLCKDMGTTEKAVGTWDYKKFRTPDSPRTDAEIKYVCTDTIALCKAIRLYIKQRGYNTATVPLTNTGFIRTKARSLSRKDKKWRRKFLDMKLTLEQYHQLTECYHGGYTHANRYYVNRLITEPMDCYDFASSYPAVMCYEKYPSSPFVHTEHVTLEDILELKDDYAFSGYLCLINVRLKKDCPMPPMAYHKAKVCIFPEESGKSKKSQHESCLDNGKIMYADTVIYPVTDPDIECILEAYEYDVAEVANVMRATKDYLPEWLTSYLMELYYNKSTLKHADPTLYMISKGELNGCYGMMVQKIIQTLCEENFQTATWTSDSPEEEDEEEALEKFYRSRNSFLPYQYGVWITSYAQRNLFRLGKCCTHWIYSDTDSVKGYGWNKDMLDAYNAEIIRKSEERGLGVVEYNGETFRLGIADYDGHYTEFVTHGSKRYCYRENGTLRITVAGVPKDGVYCLDDDIKNFRKGFIFANTTTFQQNFRKANPDKLPKWKLKTEYLNHEGIHTLNIDDSKIEYGCAVRLSDTVYELNHTIPYDEETGMPLDYEIEGLIYE